jgi:tryptophanyl-tRNA synthetase
LKGWGKGNPGKVKGIRPDLHLVQDGTKKMSKSDESDLSRINLLDDPQTILNKMKKAKTDTFTGLEGDNPDRPEARNLLTMYELMTGYSKVTPQALQGLCFYPEVGQQGCVFPACKCCSALQILL